RLVSVEIGVQWFEEYSRRYRPWPTALKKRPAIRLRTFWRQRCVRRCCDCWTSWQAGSPWNLRGEVKPTAWALDILESHHSYTIGRTFLHVGWPESLCS